MKSSRAKKPIRERYVKLLGSEKPAPAAIPSGTLDPDEVISVTVVVRRKKSLASVLKSGRRLDREEYEQRHGAKESDLSAVKDFAQEHHLTVIESSAAKRTVILTGLLKDFETAFRIRLSQTRCKPGGTFRARTGPIMIPARLAPMVEGVLGLDDRPLATPKFQVLHDGRRIVNHAVSPASFTGDQIAKLYGYPTSTTGRGQCIAIVELGGGFRPADLQTYFASIHLPAPSVTAQSVDGGLNSPSTADGADGEVMLDIEVAGAVAPEAKQIVYFAPNTDQGFLDAIKAALHDKVNQPSVISISWGASESQWTKQSLQLFNDAFQSAAVLGVTVCAAAGDSGSSDNVTDGKVHVDFPASSPYVLACGGTRLVAAASKISAETVWHDSASSATGGGVSEVFALPAYQSGKGVPVSASTKFKGRGVPDVAGNADPQTGYRVRVDGQDLVIGGTSAVAPLMAGLIARLNQKANKPVGYIHAKLYATPAKFCRDITTGDNITTTTKLGYRAAAGWDACTGWGVMNNFSV